MRLALSIKQRLLLLLLLAIALVLALVGSALDYLLHRYYENLANEHFARLFREVSIELHSRESRLSHSVSELTKRDDVISSVNMVFRYTEPEAYEPHIFDVEKQKLARELRHQVLASGIGQMAIYDGSDALVAFFSKRKDEVSGFVSFQGSAPAVFARGPASDWTLAALPPTLAALEQSYDGSMGVPRFKRGADGLMIEASSPILRTFPDGSRQLVGHVTGTEFIDEDFVSTIAGHGNAQFALYFDDGAAIGGLKDVDVARLRHVPWLDQVPPDVQSELSNEEYYLSALRAPLADGSHVYLVAGIHTSLVKEEIARSQAVMLVVLLFSALVIIPAGAVAARRMISEPVDRLVESAEALRHGDFSRKVSVPYKDELGRLAEAFNAMAEAVDQRQHALAESENRYRTLMDNLPVRVFYKDTDLVYRSCNRPFAQDRGLSIDEVVGKNDYDLFPVGVADRYRERDVALIRSGEVAEFEGPNPSDNGQTLHTVKTPVRDVNGSLVGVLGIYWDISERKQAEERLRQSAAVFESTADGVIISDAEGRIIAVNKAFTEITGFSAEEAEGQTSRILRSEQQDDAFYDGMWEEIHRTGRWQGEIWNRRKNGELHPEWMTVSVVRDEKGRIINYVSVFSDISAIKRSQAQLDYLAHHDPLTDLPNRLLFTARLEHAIERAQRRQGKIAVLFLDLDRFKNVNDTLGHPVGDLLLQGVATRLRAHLRESDTVARLGGDEFIITIEDLSDRSEAVVVAQKVLDVFGRPFVVEGSELHLGASIGISLFPTDGTDVATLVKNADVAMYLAKEQGRNTYRFYTSSLGIETRERFQLESSLRRAMERGELELFYQPQVDMQTGRIVGAESLLRWRHPEFGAIPPERFVPLAEDTGLILAIGDWALNAACGQYMKWREMGFAIEHIAVNLSGIQVERGDLVESVKRALLETGIPPGALELEITESVVMAHPALATGILDGLRALGVALAIDDFGTGYSSLSYLKRFALDNLKIDKSFVRGVPEDTNDAAIVRAVIALAANLQLKVTAEGVETSEQRDFLVANGCRRGQGYFFSPPLSAEGFEAMAVREQARSVG